MTLYVLSVKLIRPHLKHYHVVLHAHNVIHVHSPIYRYYHVSVDII